MEDRIVWDYASEHRFIVVTRDSDFSELSTFGDFHLRSFGFGVETAPLAKLKRFCVRSMRRLLISPTIQLWVF